ncbi:MAG: glycosyltransferase [Bacteroidaceae bacterium]|nr:glycosyltransferase [Bacteroidaceae bacterium]
MKILHVITSLLTGGAEKLMVDLLPRMKGEGHEVELCVFDKTRTPFYEQLEKAGIRIYSFVDGVDKVYSLKNLYCLWRLIRKGKYDIVHTHNTAPQLFAAFGDVLCSVVLCTTEHNTSNRRRGWTWYAPLDRWMFSRYKKVICISDQAEINHRAHVGEALSGNVCTIYNGIDYDRYAHASAAQDVRGIGRKIITNVAGFRYQKDQPTLIRAMAFLPEEFHLCLAGDGERREEYEGIIAELGLQDRVHLLGLRSDIPEVLAASDYVVMCSHFEGLSLSSLEGMASGRPFLASDVDGLHEIVDGNGVLFAHEDAKGFAEAVMRLEGDEEYRREIVRKCQAKAAKYDVSVMVERYLGVYEEVALVQGQSQGQS